jgi:hypothetical protein
MKPWPLLQGKGLSRNKLYKLMTISPYKPGLGQGFPVYPGLGFPTAPIGPGPSSMWFRPYSATRIFCFLQWMMDFEQITQSAFLLAFTLIVA